MKFIKIANPIPPANYRGKLKEDENLREVKEIIDENIDQLPNPNIEDPSKSLDYLGNGMFGIAYTSPNNDFVTKYTYDPSEVENAQKIMEIQKKEGPIPFVANIINFRNISKGAYWLQLEKLNPINRFEEDIADELQGSDLRSEEVFKYLLHQNFDGNKKAEKFMREWQAIQKWLLDNEFEASDLHGGNLGRKPNGQLAVLDYGF